MKNKTDLIKDYLKNNNLIVILLVIFTTLVLYLFPFYNNIWWDSAVYVGIGKYIFSLGNSGIWEASRPLIWPIILGAGWKIGFNPVIFGKITTLLFSAGCIYLTYFLGKEIFNKKTALLASFLLAFTPTFFLANSQLMSAVPSTFFTLLAIYLFFKKKYLISGIFFGIAFMTRFLQLYTFITLLATYFIYFLIKKAKQEETPIIKNTVKLILGSAIFTIPFLILNYIFYKNPMYPFFLQSYMTKVTGWPWFEPLSFYFINLFKENFFVLFALPGVFFIIKEKKFNKLTIFTIFLLSFTFFNSIIHKEMRFLIVIIPYLFLISAYGTIRLIEKTKMKIIPYVLLTALAIFWLSLAFPQMKIGDFSEEYRPYYDFLESEPTNDNIWTTNPLYLMESNKKAELIYYPTLDTERAKYLQKKILDANIILFNYCDIPCPPWEQECENEKQKFFQIIQDNFQEAHKQENQECDYYIFKK